MSWAAVVTTAPRSPCTLRECVESLRICGWEPTVFAEPGSTAVDCETIANADRLGVWHNWLHACRWAVETGAPLVLTSQDDAAYHPDAREYMESLNWPADAAFISLYTPRHYSYRRDRSLRPVGMNRIRTRSLWGAVALAWRREVLAEVIAHRIATRWTGARPRSGSPAVIERRRQNPHLIANSDTAIGKIANAIGRKMYFLDPSPVTHIAPVSSIPRHGTNTGNRNAGRIADHSLPLEYQLNPPA